jgi:hypothetical protein
MLPYLDVITCHGWHRSSNATPNVDTGCTPRPRSLLKGQKTMKHFRPSSRYANRTSEQHIRKLFYPITSWRRVYNNRPFWNYIKLSDRTSSVYQVWSRVALITLRVSLKQTFYFVIYQERKVLHPTVELTQISGSSSTHHSYRWFSQAP